MSTATHPVSPETVMAFLDGELSSAESASLSAHIDSCPDCSALASKLRGTSQSLSNWQVNPPTPALQDRVLRASSEHAPSAAGSFHLFPWFRTLLAHPLPWGVACLLLVALVGLQMGYHKRAPMQYDRSVLYPASPSEATPLSAPSRGRSVDYAQANKLESASEGGLDTLTASPSPEIPSRSPMIARTIELQITATKFDTVRATLDAILARYNAYAATLTSSTQQGNARSIHASLRIPAAQLSAALAELKALGHVESETQAGEEVTQQHADLVARLKNSRETEQRLQSILTQRTGKISDVLEVEQEIARVRGEIEQMEAQQKSLEHRVTFVTVSLQLNEEYKAPLGSAIPPTSTRLHNALVAGYRYAVESLISLLLFFAQSGPFLILWLVILFLPSRWLWRRWRSGYAHA